MRRTRKKQTPNIPNAANEEVPPGATARAADRPTDPGGGPPGSGAGPRHAADDEGSPNEEYGATDSNQPLAEPPQFDEPDPLEQGPPYAGPAGGAVGGTPAEGRAVGGTTGGGIASSGVHRGDSTIGSKDDPTPPRRKRGKRK